MTRFLTSSARWLRAGWFWPLVLLALPNCVFDPRGVSSIPRTTLNFCDIERPLQRRCATATDRALGVRLSEAALALNTGRTSVIGIDDSPAAIARCGALGEAVPLLGPFPEGQPACLDPADFGTNQDQFADPRAACVARCEDMFGSTDAQGNFVPDRPPGPGVVAFCEAHAAASAGVPFDLPAFPNLCTPNGGEDPAFDTPALPDPRRIPEPVVWTDGFGVAVGSFNSLQKTGPNNPPQNPIFDSGAASAQFITKGDAYVEFSAAETTLSHVAGLSQVTPGPDQDYTLNDINAAISLNSDGLFYVIESGTIKPGPNPPPDTSFGAYTAGQRFRVTVRDNQDGTASVAYSRIDGSCNPGSECNEIPIAGSSVSLHYPLRVDTSFREQGATLTNVTLVRIHN